MNPWLIPLIVIELIAHFIVAEEFYEISKMKGYTNCKYYWYALLFAIIGYLLIIALPVNTAIDIKTINTDSSDVNNNDQ